MQCVRIFARTIDYIRHMPWCSHRDRNRSERHQTRTLTNWVLFKLRPTLVVSSVARSGLFRLYFYDLHLIVAGLARRLVVCVCEFKRMSMHPDLRLNFINTKVALSVCYHFTLKLIWMKFIFIMYFKLVFKCYWSILDRLRSIFDRERWGTTGGAGRAEMTGCRLIYSTVDQ